MTESRRLSLVLCSATWLFRISVVFFGGLLSLTPCSSRGAPGAASQPAGGGNWTVPLVVSALEWREGRLAECSLRFSETCHLSHDKTPGEQDLTSADVIVRRHKGAIWTELAEQNHRDPQLNVDDLLSLWNGSRSTSLLTQKREHLDLDLHGAIRQVEPEMLRTKIYFTVLGLRHGEVPLPWSAVLRQHLAEGFAATINEERA